MRYSLAQLIRNTRRGRKTVFRFETAPPTKVQQDELLALVMAPVKAWREQVQHRVFPAYDAALLEARLTRDDVNQLESALDAAQDEITRLVLTLTPALRSWAIRVERWHREKFRGTVKTASGVDLATIIGRDGAEQSLDVASARIAGLIRNLSEDATNRIRNLVWESFTRREPRRLLAKRIYDEALVASKSRADLIARDQTTKLAALLDQERQEEAGIDRYTWVHSRKARPRLHHVQRNGKVFEWRKPPYDGHPGFAINCGCKAQAYLDLDED